MRTRTPLTRRLLAGAALVAAVSLTLAACGSSDSEGAGDADGSGGSTTKVTVGYFKGGAFGAQVADAEKFFADEGIDVEFKSLQAGPAILQATALKQVDIGFGDVYAWASGISNGFDNVELIAPGNTTPGWLYAAKDSGVTKASDLVGKKIGVTPTPFPATLVKNWLTQNGVDPSKVELATVAVGSQASALQSGSVDAVFSFDFVTNARLAQVGGTELVDLAQVDGVNPAATNAAYYANSTFLKDKPEAAAKFVKALRRAAASFNDGSADVKAKDTALVQGTDLKQLSQELPGLLDDPAWTTLQPGALDVDATQEWVDLGVKFGSVPKPVTIADHLFETATQAG